MLHGGSVVLIRMGPTGTELSEDKARARLNGFHSVRARESTTIAEKGRTEHGRVEHITIGWNQFE